MKTKNLVLWSVIVSMTFLSSCGKNNQQSKASDSSITKQKHEPVSKSVNATESEAEICSIKGEDITIYVGPGLKFDKLINQKATEALGETYYANVDYTFKVVVDEEKNGWSKIRVIEPEHLSSTHIGWIPSKNIVRKNKGQAKDEKLDKNSFEIIKTIQKPTVKNYYVLYKLKKVNKDDVIEFMGRFRKEYCSGSSNVNLFDSKAILNLVDKYQLAGKEYIIVADHFIAMSTFDSPELVWWYPFQDINYKDYGGKNWKKEPIK